MKHSPRPSDDQKDIIIAGCHVQLTYGQAAAAGWTVSATIRCGAGDTAGEQSVVTRPFDSREAAEHDALEQVSELLGNNTDRSRSRVRNWS
jgi:hypothetical protein